MAASDSNSDTAMVFSSFEPASLSESSSGSNAAYLRDITGMITAAPYPWSASSSDAECDAGLSLSDSSSSLGSTRGPSPNEASASSTAPELSVNAVLPIVVVPYHGTDCFSDIPLGPLSTIFEYLDSKDYDALSRTCVRFGTVLADPYWGRMVFKAFVSHSGTLPQLSFTNRKLTEAEVRITYRESGEVVTLEHVRAVCDDRLPIKEFTDDGKCKIHYHERNRITWMFEITNLAVGNNQPQLSIRRRAKQQTYNVTVSGAAPLTSDTVSDARYEAGYHGMALREFMTPWFVTYVVVPRLDTFFKIRAAAGGARARLVHDCLDSKAVSHHHYYSQVLHERTICAYTDRLIAVGAHECLWGHDPNPLTMGRRSPLYFLGRLKRAEYRMKSLCPRYIKKGWWYTFDSAEDHVIYRRMRIEITEGWKKMDVYERNILYPQMSDSAIEAFLLAGCPV